MPRALLRRVLTHRFTREWLLSPPEYLLHDSVFRIQFFALVLIVAEPLAYLLWGHLLLQPAESPFLRASAAMLALPLAMPFLVRAVPRKLLEFYWLFVCWYALPFSCWYLYRINGYTEVGMGTCVAMIFVLFQLTDWRLAVMSLLTGAAAALFAEKLVGQYIWVPTFPLLDHIPILLFAFFSSLGLALSASNLRRERMRASLITIGVMAHEMRTPLAAASMLADSAKARSNDPAHVEVVAKKLGEVFASMHAMIDYQLGNVRLTDIPEQREVVDIGKLVEDAVNSYPMANRVFKSSVSGSYQPGLQANVHPAMMRQVIHNLLRNSLSSVQATGRRPEPGDIDVIVEVGHGGRGTLIQVRDRGIGISAERLKNIFEPFQSTSSTPAHGLGLTMCRNAVESFQGEIWCVSKEGQGAVFNIALPPVKNDRPAWRRSAPAALKALDPKNWP